MIVIKKIHIAGVGLIPLPSCHDICHGDENSNRKFSEHPSSPETKDSSPREFKAKPKDFNDD